MYVFKELNVFAQRSWCGGFGGNLVVMLFSGFSFHICVKMVYTQKSDKKILFIETNGDGLQTQEVKLRIFRQT